VNTGRLNAAKLSSVVDQVTDPDKYAETAAADADALMVTRRIRNGAAETGVRQPE
jgi:hypothetical protein